MSNEALATLAALARQYKDQGLTIVDGQRTDTHTFRRGPRFRPGDWVYVPQEGVNIRVLRVLYQFPIMYHPFWSVSLPGLSCPEMSVSQEREDRPRRYYAKLGEHTWTRMPDLPESIRFTYEPYIRDAVITDLHWAGHYNNHPVLEGVVESGTETAYLMGHSASKDIAGKRQVIYGVTVEELEAGCVRRIAS